MKTGISNIKKTDRQTIPVVEEKLFIDTRKTITGEIDIEQNVSKKIVDVVLPTLTTEYTETRIPFNKVVDDIPGIRHEDDVVIIPVVREETVLVKRLVLVEEIHLTRTTNRTERTEEVTLRRTEVSVTKKSINPDVPG